MNNIENNKLVDWSVYHKAPYDIYSYLARQDFERAWHYCNKGPWLLWVIGHTELDYQERFKKLAAAFALKTPDGQGKTSGDYLNLWKVYPHCVPDFLSGKAGLQEMKQALKETDDRYDRRNLNSGSFLREFRIAPILAMISTYTAYFTYQTAANSVGIHNPPYGENKTGYDLSESYYRKQIVAETWQAAKVKALFPYPEVLDAVQRAVGSTGQAERPFSPPSPFREYYNLYFLVRWPDQYYGPKAPFHLEDYVIEDLKSDNQPRFDHGNKSK